MKGGPYHIAVEFKQDCLVGATGMPETHLIVEYRTKVDNFWIAYSAKSMADFMHELLTEIASMPPDYRDQVWASVGRFINDYEAKAEAAYVNKILAQTEGGQPWKKQAATPLIRPAGMTGHG